MRRFIVSCLILFLLATLGCGTSGPTYEEAVKSLREERTELDRLKAEEKALWDEKKKLVSLANERIQISKGMLRSFDDPVSRQNIAEAEESLKRYDAEYAPKFNELKEEIKEQEQRAADAKALVDRLKPQR